MNTKILGAIVVVVVVAGGGYVLISKKSSPATDTTKTLGAQATGEYATVGEATATGKPIKCEYVQTQTGASSKVVYYISGENVRAEVTAVNTTSFMILTKNGVSTWNDLTTKPKVVSLPTGLGLEAVVTSMLRTPLTGFDCRETKIEASLFTAPA